jgi:hypothetical protein
MGSLSFIPIKKFIYKNYLLRDVGLSDFLFNLQKKINFYGKFFGIGESARVRFISMVDSLFFMPFTVVVLLPAEVRVMFA